MAFSFASLFSSAVSLEPTIAAALKSLTGLLPANPTAAATTITDGGAEVGLAMVVQKAIPAVTASDFAAMKTAFGNAVAVFMTSNPTDALSALDVPANVSAIEASALAGIATKLGIDVSKLPASATAHLMVGAINAYKAGLGTAAVKV